MICIDTYRYVKRIITYRNIDTYRHIDTNGIDTHRYIKIPIVDIYRYMRITYHYINTYRLSVNQYALIHIGISIRINTSLRIEYQ